MKLQVAVLIATLLTFTTHALPQAPNVAVSDTEAEADKPFADSNSSLPSELTTEKEQETGADETVSEDTEAQFRTEENDIIDISSLFTKDDNQTKSDENPISYIPSPRNQIAAELPEIDSTLFGNKQKIEGGYEETSTYSTLDNDEQVNHTDDEYALDNPRSLPIIYQIAAKSKLEEGDYVTESTTLAFQENGNSNTSAQGRSNRHRDHQEYEHHRSHESHHKSHSSHHKPHSSHHKSHSSHHKPHSSHHIPHSSSHKPHSSHHKTHSSHHKSHSSHHKPHSNHHKFHKRDEHDKHNDHHLHHHRRPNDRHDHHYHHDHRNHHDHQYDHRSRRRGHNPDDEQHHDHQYPKSHDHHVHYHDHSYEHVGLGTCIALPISIGKPPGKTNIRSYNSQNSGQHHDSDHHHPHHSDEHDQYDYHHHEQHDRHGHADRAHDEHHRREHSAHHHKNSNYNGHHNHRGGQDCHDCHHHHHHREKDHHRHHDRRRHHHKKDQHDERRWNFGNIFKLPMIGHKISFGISGGVKSYPH